MIASKDMEMYDSGLVTDEYIYDKCDTDLEMYNFYASHLCMDKDEIKEAMRNVSGANDAYNNALAQAEE